MRDTRHQPAIGAVPALAMLVALVPLIALFMWLAATLGIAKFQFAGFLFILYWTGIKGMAPAAFWPSLLGFLGGLALAFLVHVLPPMLGTVGFAIVGLGVALATWLLIREQAAMLVNHAFMVMLTIGTSPAFGARGDYAAAAIAILLGALYAGALVLLIGRLIRLRAARVTPG